MSDNEFSQSPDLAVEQLVKEIEHDPSRAWREFIDTVTRHPGLLQKVQRQLKQNGYYHLTEYANYQLPQTKILNPPTQVAEPDYNPDAIERFEVHSLPKTHNIPLSQEQTSGLSPRTVVSKPKKPSHRSNVSDSAVQTANNIARQALELREKHGDYWKLIHDDCYEYYRDEKSGIVQIHFHRELNEKLAEEQIFPNERNERSHHLHQIHATRVERSTPPIPQEKPVPPAAVPPKVAETPAAITPSPGQKDPTASLAVAEIPAAIMPSPGQKDPATPKAAASLMMTGIAEKVAMQKDLQLAGETKYLLNEAKEWDTGFRKFWGFESIPQKGDPTDQEFLKAIKDADQADTATKSHQGGIWTRTNYIKALILSDRGKEAQVGKLMCEILNWDPSYFQHDSSLQDTFATLGLSFSCLVESNQKQQS